MKFIPMCVVKSLEGVVMMGPAPQENSTLNTVKDSNPRLKKKQCFKNWFDCRPVTFPVQFPLLGRLSIGLVLNRLGRRLNCQTAWAERFLENRTVQHHNLYLTKWANLVHSPSRPNIVGLPLFLTKWTRSSPWPNIHCPHPSCIMGP